MHTIIRSAKKEIIIGPDQPFVVIGEKINPTGRKKLSAVLKEGNWQDYVKELALSQVAAGADVLDVNVGTIGVDEPALLPVVAKLVAETVDVPLNLDSAFREALVAAIPTIAGKPLVNSVNGEEAALNLLLPVVKDCKVAVIGLCMDDTGIPNDPEIRLSIADKIINRAAQIGIPIEDVVIDPLVMTVGADDQAARNTLRTIELVRDTFGVNMCMGASNVSFGLPDRETINKAFMAMAIREGVTCAITDPAKLTATIRAADLLMGRDSYGGRFIGYSRAMAKAAAESADKA